MEHNTSRPLESGDPGAIDTVSSRVMSDVQRRIAARQPFLAAAPDSPEVAEGLRDSRWEIRSASVRALGAAGDAQAIATALTDGHPLVRVAAVRALALVRMGRGDHTIGMIDTIAQAFHDDDWRVREAVVLSLSELQPAHPLLRMAQIDSNREVRAAATAALEPAIVSIARPAQTADVTRRVARACHHLAQVCVAQRKVIHPGVWVTSGAIMLATGAFSVTAALATSAFAHSASVLITVATLLCAGLAIAFLGDERHEPGREIELATSTSPGVVLLCRGALVTAYVALWSLAVSGALALVVGASWLSLITLWTTPLAALAALALALAVVAGSAVSAAGSAALIVVQACRVSLAHGLAISFDAHFWSLSPLTLMVTLAALTVAVVAAGRPRLAEAAV